MFKFKIVLFIGVLLLIFVTFWSGGKENKELVVTDFSIEKGDSVWKVAKNLKSKSLTDKKVGFIIYMYKEGMQKEIKAGDYRLNSNLSIPEIAEIITIGKVIEEEKDIKITFPEGWSTAQMAARLDENDFSGEVFLGLIEKPEYFLEKYDFEFLKNIPEGKNMEGFLFPDTYFLSHDISEEMIIKKILDNFDKKFSEDLRKEIAIQKKTVYEIITLASIIEREVKINNDKRLVSGVFWNRLEIGQALQSCATLAFIRGDNKLQYSYEDTRIDSLYNTYLYPGLPPGPIANPGLESIKAAVYPEDNNYIYFLNNLETGETIFSETLDEHNFNKVKNGL